MILRYKRVIFTIIMVFTTLSIKTEEVDFKNLDKSRAVAIANSNKTRILKQSNKNTKTNTYKNKKYTYADVILLARLIQSESIGESYASKVAVGNVVLNRSRQNVKWMKKVIYSRGAFSGVNKRLYNRPPNKECIKASIDVLEGKNNIGNATHFVNLSIARPSWTRVFKKIKKIDQMTFYENTEFNK